MQLNDVQRKKVTDWIAEGLKLSEIQNRLASEFSLRLTYIEVRLLVDDLKLSPKDVEPPKPPAPPAAPAATPAMPAAPLPANPLTPPPAGANAGKVSLTVDQIARPGAIVSGKVTFTDGNTADWYLDQTGRLGLAPQQQGYRPPASDVQQFQMALETELSKMGF